MTIIQQCLARTRYPTTGLHHWHAALGNIPFTNFFTTKATTSAYQVVRPADVVAGLFIPGYFVIGSPQAVPGTTNFDNLTYHPVISYIQLLNPRNLAA